VTYLKKLLAWIVMGFFIGAGFTTAMYLVGYWATDIYAEKVSSSMKDQLDDGYKPEQNETYLMEYKEFSADSGLIIEAHEPRKVPNSLDILGKIKNEGVDAWNSIQIEVELFDSSGAFVDECSEYMNGSLSPGGLEHFKVSCRRCDKNPLPEFENYTIKISDAQFKAIKKGK